MITAHIFSKYAHKYAIFYFANIHLQVLLKQILFYAHVLNVILKKFKLLNFIFYFIFSDSFCCINEMKLNKKIPKQNKFLWPRTFKTKLYFNFRYFVISTCRTHKWVTLGYLWNIVQKIYHSCLSHIGIIKIVELSYITYLIIKILFNYFSKERHHILHDSGRAILKFFTTIPPNSYITVLKRKFRPATRVCVLNPTVSSITETTHWEIVREKSISEKRTNSNSAVGLISRPVAEYTDENQLAGRPGFPASPRTTSVPISRMFVSILGRWKTAGNQGSASLCARLILRQPFRQDYLLTSCAQRASRILCPKIAIFSQF